MEAFIEGTITVTFGVYMFLQSLFPGGGTPM